MMRTITTTILSTLVLCTWPVESSTGAWRPFGIASPPSAAFRRTNPSVDLGLPPTSTSLEDDDDDQNQRRRRQTVRAIDAAFAPPRGGVSEERLDALVRIVGLVTQTVIDAGRIVLPPTVAAVKEVVRFYRALPTDAIIAQVGLLYCFAGGYYPTLFSSLQAARHCGWEVMTEAIQDLTDEALKVIDASAELRWDRMDKKEIFLRQTNLVLKTVDPEKINMAATALYTTWLGVSAVLEKEYARVISLSVSMAYYLERAAHWILEPPLRLCLHADYHRWVPVCSGWLCKGIAMNIAWRIQRVLTASTSAMAGGVMFARALLRMIHKTGFTLFGIIEETGQRSPLDEVIGFLVAGIGFWTQIQVQYKNAFSFKVPFPLSLITWPFDWLEKAIQWAITK